MPLANKDIEFIKEHIGEWLAEKSGWASRLLSMSWNCGNAVSGWKRS